MVASSPGSGLKSGENVLWHSKPRLIKIIGHIIGGIILIIIALIVGLYFPIIAFESIIIVIIIIIILILYIARFRATTYWITNMRIFQEYSFISRNIKETTLDRITDVIYNQSLMGRLLNYGDVKIHTAGIGFSGLDFEGIHDPLKVREILMNAKEAYKL